MVIAGIYAEGLACGSLICRNEEECPVVPGVLVSEDICVFARQINLPVFFIWHARLEGPIPNVQGNEQPFGVCHRAKDVTCSSLVCYMVAFRCLGLNKRALYIVLVTSDLLRRRSLQGI